MTLTDNPSPSRWLTWLNPWAARWLRSLVDMQEAQGWTGLIKHRGEKNPFSICLRSRVTLPFGNVCHTGTVKVLNRFISHPSPWASTLMWWLRSYRQYWTVEWDEGLKHAMLFMTVPNTHHEWRRECQADHYPQGRRKCLLPQDSRRLFHPETPCPMSPQCSLKQCTRESLNTAMGYIPRLLYPDCFKRHKF